MHRDSKILVIGSLKIDNSCKVTFFLLQNGWPYKGGTAVYVLVNNQESNMSATMVQMYIKLNMEL